MKRRLVILTVLALFMAGGATASTTIFDIATDGGFNDWIENKSNVTVANDQIEFNDSTTGKFTFQRFEVASHDNLTIETNGTANATLYLRGYDSNNTLQEALNFDVTNGTNEYNVTGINGTEFELEVEKTEENASLDISRIAYTGELPDSGSVVVGGDSTSTKIAGYPIEYWIIGGILALAAVVFGLNA